MSLSDTMSLDGVLPSCIVLDLDLQSHGQNGYRVEHCPRPAIPSPHLAKVDLRNLTLQNRRRFSVRTGLRASQQPTAAAQNPRHVRCCAVACFIIPNNFRSKASQPTSIASEIAGLPTAPLRTFYTSSAKRLPRKGGINPRVNPRQSVEDWRATQ